MSIQSYSTPPVRLQANWNTGLQTAAPVGGAATPVPAPPPYNARPQTDWSRWTPNDQMFDHAYDAYQFSRFPLNIGGIGLWTSGLMRPLASALGKIPQDRLNVLATRHQFMRLEGMTPDHARLLQHAYYNAASQDPNAARQKPLEWLSQFGQEGTMADWLVRGPQMIVLEALRLQISMEQGFTPDNLGSSALKRYAQAAARHAPPPAAPQPRY